MQTTCIKKGF